jgi:peptidyl-prolyl cis-trans isomerase A (cyclophilin A)
MLNSRALITIALTAALAAPIIPALAQTAPPKTTPQTAPPKAAPQPAPKAPAKAAPKTGTPAAKSTAAAPTSAAAAAAAKAKLKNPAALKDVAPAEFRASFDTSAGPFVVAVHRAWAPKGADRFYNLVKYGFFDNNRFFRVVPNFMVQFGINGDPEIQGPWREANIPDDPQKNSNKRGTMTFANRGPNSRSTQLFINFRDNANLDDRFTPFGEVVSGMESVDKIYAEYGERPDQMQIQARGNAYLTPAFPKLDFVKKATIVRVPATTTPTAAPKKAPPKSGTGRGGL